MSKSIKEHIVGTAKITAKRGEDEQDFLKRCIKIIAEVSDEDWKALSTDAQEWFNKAVEDSNDNKKITPFPEEAPAPAATKTRAKKAEKEKAPAEPESVVGAEVKVTTARGKVVVGTITEIDSDSMVVTDGKGEEHEFDRTRVQSVEFLNEAEDEGEEAAEPTMNDAVIITTTRGKTIEGVIVEMDDEIIVVDTGTGEDVEVSRSRIDTIQKKGAAVATEPEASSEPVVGDKVEVVTKRGKEVKGTVVEIDGDLLVVGVDGGEEIEVDSTTAQAIKVVKDTAEKTSRTPTKEGGVVARGVVARGERAQKELPLEEGKKKKISAKANGGVSSTVRMREIICAEPTISMADVGKKLKAEKIDFNDNTLQINFKIVTSVIEELKKNKHYK